MAGAPDYESKIVYLNENNEIINVIKHTDGYLYIQLQGSLLSNLSGLTPHTVTITALSYAQYETIYGTLPLTAEEKEEERIRLASVPKEPMSQEEMAALVASLDNLDLSPPCSALKSFELPKEKFSKVRVDTLLSPTEAWVHSAKSMRCIKRIENALSVEADENKVAIPQKNQVYMALIDGTWHRVLVKRKEPKMIILLIDYGTEMLHSGRLREISEHMKSVPSQIIRIKLATGVPCQLCEGMIMRVKPVKVEDNVTVVLVKDGSYL